MMMMQKLLPDMQPLCVHRGFQELANSRTINSPLASGFDRNFAFGYSELSLLGQTNRSRGMLGIRSCGVGREMIVSSKSAGLTAQNNLGLLTKNWKMSALQQLLLSQAPIVRCSRRPPAISSGDADMPVELAAPERCVVVSQH